MSTPVYFTDEYFYADVLQSPVTVAVYFTAGWSGLSRDLRRIFDEVANSNSTVKFGVIDVDRCPATTVRYGVRELPATFIFKNGEITGRLIGSLTKAKLEALIN